MSESEIGSATTITDELGGTQLDLGVHKFIIGSSKFGQSNSIALNSGDSKRIFSCLEQVKKRCSACSFCDLAYRAVQRYSGIRVSTDAPLYLTWEVDGRQITEGDRIVNRTRRIRLSWRETDGKQESVYLVLVAPKSSRRINSDAYTANAIDSHFLGRGLLENKEKQALMKSWIDLCVDQHGSKCTETHATSHDFKKLIRSTFFGVVDVLDMQLKALPVVNGKPERYVALSYVWGKNPLNGKAYTTTRANVMIRIQHGGLESAWERLPRTIQEAILLVARLGERYIWIDSLCIVQDSTSSWELNAKAMHLVYGNAHFTICAADGDVDMGLRAISHTLHPTSPISQHKRTATTSSPPIVSINHMMLPRKRAPSPAPGSKLDFPSSHGMTTEEVRGTLRSAETADLPPLTTECLPNVRLLVSKPPEAVIEDSIWYKRGWTFQERLLSRRCLIFAEGQLFFQCRSTVISQHIFTDGGINGWSLDWTNSPLRTLGELPRRAFWFYMKCVPLYTGRNLTKPKDILAAFRGTSWILQKQFNAPLFYGLPSSHFDLALLWMPCKQLDRRRQKSQHKSNALSCSQDETGNCKCKKEDDDYGGKEFPSWSWSGWMGGKADYASNMTDGCVSNVQEWLRDHTWIRWYVRDYEGNLRPLWDMEHLLEDRSTESRWRGYAGRRDWEIQTNHASSQLPPSGPVRQYVQQYSPPPPPATENYRPPSAEYPPPPPGLRRFRPLRPRLPRREHHAEEDSYWSEEIDDNDGEPTTADNSGATEDSYGRPIRAGMEKLNATNFTGILPDNPFSIIRGPFSAPEDGGDIHATPILQFWTVVDKSGDWCGSIALPSRFLHAGTGGPDDGAAALVMFIALSDARSLTVDECPTWNYYIPKEREESEWDLYYVMLVERNRERALWERVAVGKVFRAAFRDAVWDEIKLG
ncbi:Heterokaryon incompatibility protein [Apiospora kogelbergensis]|uniref:Heterokaryon incompatibility protein n=1 Tax=Apiospora kogelbergensis TaxID=1337665 RepID=UPI003131C43C